MANKVRCKACGFIMDEGAYDECPACGVPSKMFEPFEDKVPEGRRKWLELHFHPVIVHAPQALGFLLILLVGLYLILVQAFGGGRLAEMLLPTVQIMSILLPITTFGGIVSGIIDGKMRYKRVDTILLKRKMLVGSIFLVLAVVMAVIAFLPSFRTGAGMQILYLVLNIGAFLCSMFLGIWGSALFMAVMPGPMPKKKKKA